MKFLFFDLFLEENNARRLTDTDIRSSLSKSMLNNIRYSDWYLPHRAYTSRQSK